MPELLPHLRDHLADGRPKGLFHRTPCSCTLVLMSRGSESDCSMDDQGDNREARDEEENMLSGLPTPEGGGGGGGGVDKRVDGRLLPTRSQSMDE